jgi:hypothetical protein
MELCKFKGIIYGRLKKNYFVFETEWDSFRPIERIAWDGNKVVIIDKYYKQDIFSPFYGFGSDEMKRVCKRLTEVTELGVPESDTMPWLDEEWFRDRRCNFAYICTPRTTDSWIKYVRYLNSKPRTIRNHRETKMTRRLVPR